MGKSNILDAVMFLFCNEKNKDENADVRDAITRYDSQESTPRAGDKRFCEVRGTFKMERGGTLWLARRVTAQNEVTYLIDGEECSRAQY